MLKILRILNRLNIGGPTYNVVNLSAALPSTYETKVLAGYKEESEGSSEYLLKEKGINYQFVPGMFRSIHPKNDLKAYRFIKKEIETYKPDIVHTHAAKAGALGRLAAHFAKNKPKLILHTYHGNVFDGYFSPLKTKIFLTIERYLCKISTAIIAISEQQKEDLVFKYKLAPAVKVNVIKLGFDLSAFTTNREEKRKLFRDFYKLTDDDVVITITGRITPIKNHALFIEALVAIRNRFPDSKFKVFIVGDGEVMPELITQITTSGFSYCLPDRKNFDATIILTSWRKDIDVINAGSDIIALTSKNEGTPVSIIEGQASGKAVICTNVGGVKDVVKDNNTGILCEEDGIEFGIKLNDLICDKVLRERLGKAGEIFAHENYSTSRLINDMDNLYRSLLKKKENP